MTSPSSDFSALRAARDVGLTLLVAALFGFAMAKLHWLVASEADGQGLGKALFGIALLALAASWGAQTGRQIVFYGAAAVILFLALKLPGSIALGEGRASRGLPLTAEELAAPSLPADMSPKERAARPFDRLCQEALGFSLALPRDAFSLDTETAGLASRRLEQAMGKNQAAWWGWSSVSRGQQFTVAVAKGAASSPEAFARFTAGIRATAVETEGITIDREELVTKSGPYSYRLAMTRSDGLAKDVYCLSPVVPDRKPLAVCAVTFAARHNALQASRESIEFGTCSPLLF